MSRSLPTQGRMDNTTQHALKVVANYDASEGTPLDFTATPRRQLEIAGAPCWSITVGHYGATLNPRVLGSYRRGIHTHLRAAGYSWMNFLMNQ